MILKCYIIDDDIATIRTLSEYIDRHSELVLVGYDTNPVAGLDKINNNSVDLVFLGINESLVNGLELSSLISHSVYKIFVTALPDFALAAFDNNAFDYLLKPISKERFLRCVKKLSSYTEKTHKAEKQQLAFIYVKSESKGKLVKIEFDEVYYIESNDNYIVINLAHAKHKVYIPLKAVLNKFSSSNFIRVHKSFIVNHSKISYIQGAQIILKDKTTLQLGSSYKDRFLSIVEKYTLKHHNSDFELNG